MDQFGRSKEKRYDRRDRRSRSPVNRRRSRSPRYERRERYDTQHKREQRDNENRVSSTKEGDKKTLREEVVQLVKNETEKLEDNEMPEATQVCSFDMTNSTEEDEMAKMMGFGLFGTTQV